MTAEGKNDDEGDAKKCVACADGFFSQDDETCIECEANFIGTGIHLLENK